MEIELKKTSISLPKIVMDVLDRQAKEWMTPRSAAITRIVMEWQKAKTENPQENPTEQMKKNGAPPLVEA